MKHNLKKQIICGIVAASTMLSSGAVVFADDEINLRDYMKAATLAQSKEKPLIIKYKHDGFRNVINKLVEEGKLTKEKSEKIFSFMKEKEEERNKLTDDQKEQLKKQYKFGIIIELKTAGIINDAEADMIRTKVIEMKEQAFNGQLDKAVQQGIINANQANKIKEYRDAAKKEKLEKFNKLQQMTEEEKKAFFKEYKHSKKMFEKLIDDGVLTEKQVEELKNMYKEGKKEKCDKH